VETLTHVAKYGATLFGPAEIFDFYLSVISVTCKNVCERWKTH